MNKKRNPELTGFSQELRKKMTKEEKRLWYDYLKKIPETFYRQKVIGNYIVDFCCCEAMLIIELDGEQHYSEKGIEKDASRDAYLRDLGYRVLRITNHDLNTNFDGVCVWIRMHIDQGKGACPRGDD